jgi:phosphoserine aminotransferase
VFARGCGSCSRCRTATRWHWANGGSTAFWDIATFSLIRERPQHVVCGEFSAKFAAVTASAPFLAEPQLLRTDYGTGTSPRPERIDYVVERL